MLSSQLSLHSISKEVSPLVEDLERKRSAAHDKKICAQEDQEEAIWDTVEVVDEDERMVIASCVNELLISLLIHSLPE